KGGAISLNATSGTPAISLGGNMTAQGGTGIGAAGGTGAGVTIQDPTTLTANVTIASNGGTGTSAGAGGAVAFTAAGSAAVNSDATPRSLTVNAGTANVTFGAAVGNASPLASL